MVTVINFGRSLRDIIYYNERKVSAGVAACLEAAGYPKDTNDLSFHQKLARFEKLTDLNQNTKLNSVHVSLNFDPSEKISKELLTEIAAVYMIKIGFAGQPFLLYQHSDTVHPHGHIVATNIRSDGSRIDLHNIGRNQSEEARKQIEIRYGLIKAEKSKTQPVYEGARKIHYGKMETFRAIANVINAVVPHYKYSSLLELNMVLRQYNVIADRGRLSSWLFKHHGLNYRLIDDFGKRVGLSINAGMFLSKPTLKNLEERFKVAEAERGPYTSRLKNLIDLTFLKQPKITLDKLRETLEKQGVVLVTSNNSSDIINDLNYIDHKTKCVFNSSTLGDEYGIKRIRERCLKGVAEAGEIESGLDEKIALSLKETGEKKMDISNAADLAQSNSDSLWGTDRALNRNRLKKRNTTVAVKTRDN